MNEPKPAKHHFIVYVLAAGYYVILIGVCLSPFQMPLYDLFHEGGKFDWELGFLAALIMSTALFFLVGGIGWGMRYAIETCFRRFPSSKHYSSGLASRAIACLVFLVIAVSIWYILH